MPYTKPNTFTTAASLDSDDLNGNDDELRKYINQEIIAADIAADSIDTSDIQLGDYQPITNEYTFATGIDTGLWNGIDSTSRAYFTSNIKKGRQTDNTLEIWQSIYETGPALVLQEQADVLVTFGGTFVSQENDIEANGFWDSLVKFGYIKDDIEALTFVEQTRSYTFEEAAVTVAPAGNFSPFAGSATPSSAGDENPEISTSVRRWIGWSMHLLLPAGTYKFVIYVNPKVQQGYSSARTYKAEVFYR